MKYLLTILSVLLLSAGLMAQTTALEKVEAAKIALITERLELTPEQAEKFWPIYREYENQQKGIRQEFIELKASHDPSTSTESENAAALAKGMALREKQLNIEKTYSDKFQEVITSRQLLSLRKAEDDFKQMLLERVRQQQLQREQMQQNRLRNSETIQNKRSN